MCFRDVFDFYGNSDKQEGLNMALPIVALLSGAGKLLGDVLDNLDGEKKRQAEIMLKQLETEAENQKSQLEINNTEAQHASVWVSGWRPAFGWICAAGCAYNYLIQPVLTGVVDGRFPVIDVESLMVLVGGLLGLGGYRSFEKFKGVAR